MICYLKHKNISVLEMEIDDDTSGIMKIIDIINPNHIPIGVRFNRGVIDRRTLHYWLKGRSIPDSR